MSEIMMLDGLSGCGTCGLGALAPRDEFLGVANAFWKKARSQGIGGTALASVLELFRSAANSASDGVKWPFLYELDSRAELRLGSRVPEWLIADDQIPARLKAVVEATGTWAEGAQLLKRASAMPIFGAPKGSSTTIDLAKKPSGAEKRAAPAVVGKDKGGGVPWLLVGAGLAGVAGIALVISALRTPPRGVVAGLPARWRHRKARR